MDNSPYYDMGIPGGGRGSVNDFVLGSLLKSRIDCGFESNAAQYDEDVNVYLVHLLSDLVTGPGLATPDQLRDIDVFDRVKDSRDPRYKGEVYRTSADRLLLSTGIFVETPFQAKEGKRVFEGSAQTRIGRGKTYYHFASMFHGQSRAGSAALARILDRLSLDFERYVEVLFHMRGEYFHLYERLRDDVILALPYPAPDAAEEPDTRTDLERLRDEFLDAFWIWHHSPTPAHRALLNEAAERLRAQDPSFVFEIPEA